MTNKNLFPVLPDKRLSRRAETVKKEHYHVAGANQSGPARLPDDKIKSTVAGTQAQWRLLNNPRVTFGALLAAATQLAVNAVSPEDKYVLLVADWSMLNFGGHTAKKDRLTRTHSTDVGYELTSAILVSAEHGLPLGPVAMYLKTADRCLAAGAKPVAKNATHLSQIAPILTRVRRLNLPATPVLIIDREADAAKYYREWNAAGAKFLIRAGNHQLTWRGQSHLTEKIHQQLRAENRFHPTREITVKGKRAQQFIAETTVQMTRPNREKIAGKIVLTPGVALPLRLVIVEARDVETGKVLSTWHLLSNLPNDVPSKQLARWYYWRWNIESMFKLLKSGGQQLENWLQHTAAAIFRRLIIATTACVEAWAIRLRAERGDPAALAAAEYFFRLSGFTRKPGTLPSANSILAGLYVRFRLPAAAGFLRAFGLTQHTISQINTAVNKFYDTL
jgi:hypothetical protein